jgi:hypothetical protein
MIQTFIRTGARRFAVLTCAVAAVAVASNASAAPMMDLRSEAIALGIDPATTPSGTLRRSAPPKASGPIYFDNGPVSHINGLASELNTIVSDARSADDLEVVNTVTGITFVQARLYVAFGQNLDGRLEVYANHTGGGNCTPARPFSSNPPVFVFTTTNGTSVGSDFGYDLREYEWNTAGMNLTCGTYWITPIQVGRGSGRGFFAFSQSPHTNGCASAFRSTYFGYTDWTDARALGFDFDSSYTAYGAGTGSCGGGGGTGGGGSCDLTPIEEKLDDETRFTDDTELQQVLDGLNGLASQASVDALEAKMDAFSGQDDLILATLCDVIRLLTTPNGLREATCNGVDYTWNGGSSGGGGD